MGFCLSFCRRFKVNVVESYIQIFTKNAKIIQFLNIDVATTNNSALDVAEGAESGNDEDGKVVMEEESEKEKKP